MSDRKSGEQTWTCVKCGTVHPMDHEGVHALGEGGVTASYCVVCAPVPIDVLLAGDNRKPAPPRAAVTHVLKTAPAPWMSVRAGVKTAEFRRDDRGFEVNDLLDLRCITEGGESIVKRITHIVRGPSFGVPDGYAMLSLGDPDYLVQGDWR